MKIAYFDCFNGAGGDMIVGALIDAGASGQRLEEGLRRLNTPELAVQVEKTRKQGFASTRFTVLTEKPKQPHPGKNAHDEHHHHAAHRHLKQIRALIEAGNFPARVRDRAFAAFDRLADAEAAAHGIDREKVHFHEVGAIDSIADVVGAMLALEDLGIDRCVCSPLPVGSGTVLCEHGIMPVPAPATAILLKGIPLAPSLDTGELLTPTAAAVLTSLCTEFGPMPPMVVTSIGLGAGTREGKNAPNVTRVIIGDTAKAPVGDTVVVLEANLDDATGELVGYCMGRLLEEGAIDVYCVPVIMKKNRPGVVLTVLCTPEHAGDMESLLFAETPTLGVRRHLAARTKLARRHESVDTPFGAIRIKVGSRGDDVVNAAPEFEDCAAAARQHHAALRVVMAAAVDAWRNRSR
jgi:uncharacterized protein (TIGR00299 family) protein